MIPSACGIAADSPSGLLRIIFGYLAGRLNGRRPADILPAAGRMRASIRISARRPRMTVLRTRRAGGHRSLIAGLGSSPLGELFHAWVWVGSCAYQVSVLSGVGLCRPMMVSEVPASECQLRGSCDPKITAATVPPRSPSPRPGKSGSPPKRGGTCRGQIRRRSRQPPCSTSGTRCRRATSGGE